MPENKQTSELKVQEPQPSPSEKLVSINDVQKLVNEATYKVTNELVPKIADEAATKAVSTYIQSTKTEPANEGGLRVQDKTGAVLTYKQVKDLERETEERIRKEYGVGTGNRSIVSLGARFEDVVNQRLTDEFMGSVVSRMFGGNPATGDVRTAPVGLVGNLLHELKGILDTKFGYGLGEKVGDKATELVKMFGTERIGAMMDAASGKVSPGQQQIEQAPPTPEEQQKALENALMSLDTTNISDMTKFMEANKLKNFDEARNLLLSLQDKILQSRGLVRASPVQAQSEDSASNEGSRVRSKNKQGDINRNLIDRYDNPDQFTPRGQLDNFSPPGADFFGGAGTQPDSTFQQSQEEIILSLNPDEPSSLHSYSAMRNIVNLDATTIKKMLMQEQRNLLSKTSSPVQEVNQPNITSPSVQDAEIVSHRGISPDEDQAKIKKGLPFNEFLVETLPKEEKPVSNQQPINNVNPKSADSHNPTSDDSAPIDTIMRILNKLDNKIDYLDSEIKALKLSSKIKADDFTDISSSEEQILNTKTVDIDNIIKKTPRIAILNEITQDKEVEEGSENDIPTISNDVSKTGQEDTKGKKEIGTNVPKSQDKTETDKIEAEKGTGINESKETIDWWGERSKLTEDKTDETIKKSETNKKEHKKFTIGKRQ